MAKVLGNRGKMPLAHNSQTQNSPTHRLEIFSFAYKFRYVFHMQQIWETSFLYKLIL